jgi:hypothetical protein
MFFFFPFPAVNDFPNDQRINRGYMERKLGYFILRCFIAPEFSSEFVSITAQLNNNIALHVN